MKHLTDEELVRHFINTQKDIYFEHIYNRYADKVYRKCLSFVKDSAKAEDYTHDIFMKLVMSMSSYREHAKFSTWLYSITYNYCVDKVRIGKKMAEEELNENIDFVDEDIDVAELREIEAQKLKESLEQVSVDEKSILLMKYQDDMSIKEIADILNITESAVKMRLKRAKEKVKKVYLENLIFWVILVSKFVSTMKDSLFFIIALFLYIIH
jgi:RNA polymerase sigma factor (sigma-70 family)